ncbi:hypothetical protein Ancab_038668 [Ancistrocladus abbreviatus]
MEPSAPYQGERVSLEDILHRLPTVVNLRKKGLLHGVSSGSSVLCGTEDEDENHTLIRCPRAYELKVAKVWVATCTAIL